LSILIETMRREGYEFSVARPEVIFKEIDGRTCEPWELLTIEVPDQYVGVITTAMGLRKAQLQNMQNLRSVVRFDYKIATRQLIGFRQQLLTETSGMGVLNSVLLGYEPMGAEVPWTRNGVIIAAETGTALSYSIEAAQQRGITLVGPGADVYAGMIVGLHAKVQDIVMNVCKGKKATNVRNTSADILIRLAPPRQMSLEQCLTFLAPDELLEVTPHHLRLRKRDLSAAARH